MEELLAKITGITNTQYSNEDIEQAIEDLLIEYDVLQEKITDLEKDIEENYNPKPFNPYVEYGVNERDFI